MQLCPTIQYIRRNCGTLLWLAFRYRFARRGFFQKALALLAPASKNSRGVDPEETVRHSPQYLSCCTQQHVQLLAERSFQNKHWDTHLRRCSIRSRHDRCTARRPQLMVCIMIEKAKKERAPVHNSLLYSAHACRNLRRKLKSHSPTFVKMWHPLAIDP